MVTPCDLHWVKMWEVICADRMRSWAVERWVREDRMAESFWLSADASHTQKGKFQRIWLSPSGRHPVPVLGSRPSPLWFTRSLCSYHYPSPLLCFLPPTNASILIYVGPLHCLPLFTLLKMWFYRSKQVLWSQDYPLTSLYPPPMLLTVPPLLFLPTLSSPYPLTCPPPYVCFFWFLNDLYLGYITL